MSRSFATMTLALFAIGVFTIQGSTVRADESQASAPGVRLERGAGWSVVEATVEGELISYALPKGSDGRREIVLLVAPLDLDAVRNAQDEDSDDEGDDRPTRLPPCPDDPGETTRAMRLYRLDATGKGSLTPYPLHEVPGESTAIDAVDLDGDGDDELLLARESGLFRVDPTGLVPLVEVPDFGWERMHPRITVDASLAGRAQFATTTGGRVGLYGPSANTGSWGSLSSLDLPRIGRAGSGSISVYTPIPTFVGALADGTWIFASRPRRAGKQRLRTNVFRISTSGVSSSVESWARLPEPEDVLEYEFLIVDGQPALFVATRPANKLTLFGEKRIRIFPLEHDRTRLGRPPLLAAESNMNLWQQSSPVMLDVTGDGREDLVVGYWKGLKNSRVALDAYRRLPDGSFAGSPRTTAFDVENGDRSLLVYGHDFNGDDVADLIVADETRILLYEGKRSTTGRKLVSKKPAAATGRPSDAGDTTVTVSFGSEPGNVEMHQDDREQPRFADLDGDGREELLLARGAAPGLFRVVRFAVP